MILGKVLNLALPRAGLFLPQDAGPLHLSTAICFTSPQISVLEVRVFVTFFVSAALSLECYFPTQTPHSTYLTLSVIS